MLEIVLKPFYKQDYVTEDKLAAMFSKRGIDLKFQPFNFGDVEGFLVENCSEKAFIPVRNVSYMNRMRGRLTHTQQQSLGRKIPIPLFIGQGKLTSALHELSELPEISTNEWLEDIFTPGVASIYVLEYFEKSAALRPYLQIIYESIEAYFMGLDHVAIMGLLPVVEGGLRIVQQSALGPTDDNVSSDEFSRRLGELIVKHGEKQAFGVNIYPGSSGNRDVQIDFFTHVNPQCDVINTFRIFFKEVLYRPSNDSSHGFNRHLILHLLKNDFASPANYVRVFLLLSHIAFCEWLTNADIPMTWPGSNPDSERLARYFLELEEKIGIPRSHMWRPGSPMPN